MHISAGTRLGRYDLQSRLGGGAMGDVWRAHDPRLQRTVAIKVLKDQADDAAGRVLAEARAASKLDHPHICTIHEVGEDSGTAFIVMAHVEGKPLSELIPSDGLPYERVVRYGTQIADALAHAHTHGVVHRDLKSANVVITTEGGVKLIDFGIAVPVPAQVADAMTRTLESPPNSAPMGTLAYMAPELLRGEAATARSDIWALGVLLYEMASGRLPFDGASVADVTVAIMKDAPASLPAEVPAGLRAIAQRALAKEPGRRYVTGGELRAALEAIASSNDVASTPASSAASGAAAPPSIAVLPFVNMSADPEQEYFCDGVAEEVTGALGKIDGLRVAGRTSAFSFKGKTGDLREIGRALNVSNVLEGSVRRAGDRLRIAVELVNVTDGYHLWSERYDRQVGDIFAVQDEIALAVVEALRVTLLGSEQAAVLKHSTENPEAYQLCLKARHAWYQWTDEGLRTAMRLFRQSLEEDPDYALAHFGLADCQFALAFLGHERPDPASIRAELEAALRLDPELAEAYAVLGHLERHFAECDWTLAEPNYRRALALNPRSPHVLMVHGLHLAQTGLHEESVAVMRRSVDLDPLNPFWNLGLLESLLGARDWTGSLRQARATLDLAPHSWFVLCFSGQAWAASGHLDEAISAFERSVGLSLGAPVTRGLLGHALASAGRRDEARQQLDGLRDQSRSTYVSPLPLALVHVGLQQPDDAFTALEATFDVPDPWLPMFLTICPTLDELRPDPRFADLRRRIGLDGEPTV